MGARAIVVAHVREQHVTQMAFAKDHDMINAFPADRSDQPFGVRILPWGTRRRRAISNTDRPNPTHEYFAVCAIAVPDQVTGDLLPAAGLSELIGYTRTVPCQLWLFPGLETCVAEFERRQRCDERH